MIDYGPFWETLKASETETWYTLVTKHHLSTSTLNRLKHNKSITTRTLNDLCRILHCQPKDIVAYIPDEEDFAKNSSAGASHRPPLHKQKL